MAVHIRRGSVRRSATPRRLPAAVRLGWAATLAVPTAARAATVTLTASDAAGQSSFNTGLHWSNSATPTAGNAYSVGAGLTLRTPTTGTAYTFAGTSLSLSGTTTNNAVLVLDTPTASTVTVNGLALAGGQVQNGGNASGGATADTLAGTISLGVANGGGTLSGGGTGRTLTVTAAVSGSGGLTVAGTAGTVVLAGTNTYAGSTTIGSGGTLQLGTGTAGQDGTFGTGAIADSGTLVVNRAAATTLANAIGGGGGLTVGGAGAVTLTAASTYYGSTVITGTVVANGNSGTGQGGDAEYDFDDYEPAYGTLGQSSAVTVAAGGQLQVAAGRHVLAGSLAGTGTVTVNGDGTYLYLGSFDTDGNSFGGVISGKPATTIANAGQVVITGATDQVFTGQNTYTIPTYIGYGATLELGDNTAGNDGDIAATAYVVDEGTLTFNRYGAVTAAYSVVGDGDVEVDGPGSQTLIAPNTYGGATYIDAGGTLQLGDGTAGHDGTINGSYAVLDGGRLVFNRYGTDTAAYDIGDNDVPGSVVKLGVGTQVLTGDNTYSGGTNVSAGVLVAGSNSALGTGPVVVGAGATLAVAANGSGGRTVLRLPGGLTLAGSAGAYTAKVDVAGNDLDLPGASLATVTAAAAQGFAGGTWNGSGGLVSSAAAADTRHLTAVGVIQNNAAGTALYTTFDGQPVGASDVLVKYTYYGDANLDGVVNAADYTRVDAGYVGHLTGWFNGDFNYDGVVDGTDYALMDNAFNQQTTALSSAVVAGPAVVVSGATAVPEPAVGGIVAVGLLVLARRRRRDRSS